MAGPSLFNRKHCLEISETCLAFNLRKADRLLTQLYDRALKGTGLRHTQFAVLVAVRGLEPAPLSQVAVQLGLERTTLSRNLELLEKEGLVESAPGEDLRERHLTVAARGHEALLVAFPRWKAIQKQMQARLGSAAMAALVRDLEQIVARS